MNPPFETGDAILCVKNTPEVHWYGPGGLCECVAGITYNVEGCVWSYCMGWLVSIDGELHIADDFRKVDKPGSKRR